MAINQPTLVLDASGSNARFEELMAFIDHAVVPILVQHWVEQSGESGSEKVEVNAEELPAAA
jgi:hypothetical protein